MVYTLAKDFVKYDGHNVELIQIFLSGSGVTRKLYLVKVICNVISKTLKTEKKRDFFYLDLKEYQR